MPTSKQLLFTTTLFLLSTGLWAQTLNDSVFTSTEIILKTPDGDISGTLTDPVRKEKSPVVLIIPGSGPTDRDCNSPMGIQTNAYKMLAEEFAKNGIATLRYDKRGIGKSKSVHFVEDELTFETYISDAVSLISLLKDDARFSKIFVLGHSEGSLIGMLAAQQAPVDAFISVAGAGRPADVILEDQLKDKLTPVLVAESNRILDSLRLGKTVPEVNRDLLMLYRPSVQPYLISWIKYNPLVEIRKLTIPVLIIQGTTDLQVAVGDAQLLAGARPDAKLVIIDNMNHVMKEAPADVQTNIAAYRNPSLPLKAGLVEEIVQFISSH